MDATPGDEDADVDEVEVVAEEEMYDDAGMFKSFEILRRRWWAVVFEPESWSTLLLGCLVDIGNERVVPRLVEMIEKLSGCSCVLGATGYVASLSSSVSDDIDTSLVFTQFSPADKLDIMQVGWDLMLISLLLR